MYNLEQIFSGNYKISKENENKNGIKKQFNINEVKIYQLSNNHSNM